MTTATANRLRIEPRPEFAKILRVEELYATPERDTAGARINGRFDRLVVQSGTAAAPDVILRLCILGGLACGGALFVATENLLWTAVALAAGAFLPIAFLLLLRTRRQRTMRRQLPALIDGLAQAARAGRGLANGLELAAAQNSAPLADEIGLAVRRLRMGVGIEAAFADLPERTGLAGMQVFVAALAGHDRTGCDLVASLDQAAKRIAAGA
jgi:tight adherence protein B